MIITVLYNMLSACMTCGPLLKPQSALIFTYNKHFLNEQATQKCWSTFLRLTFMMTCAVLFYYGIFLPIASFIFAFLCITMIVRWLGSETLRSDLKEPLTVFMINQCFSCLTNVCQSWCVLTDCYSLVTERKEKMFNYCCQSFLDNSRSPCCWLKCLLFVR